LVQLKAPQWIGRFEDVNYRMHDNTCTIDNQTNVVGSRDTGYVARFLVPNPRSN
jgi:phosphatidylserine/phosphatidylglycerophosphate/cardiolipin synthase-like enzyme